MKRIWMHAVLAGALAFVLPGAALADQGTWSTGIGNTNQVVYTLDLTCPAPGFVCDLLDGYSEQDTSNLSGLGTIDIVDASDTFQFETDSMQDVGAGLQAAYTTLTGTDLNFPIIPFAGIPEITNVLVFALSDPLITATGLDLLTPGDYPFSETISYSGTGLVIGDLEFILGPNIVVPPAGILVSGTFRVLGDIGSNGTTDYEIRDVMATFALQNVTTMGGELVTVDITADLTMNLEGQIGTPISVPALGPVAVLVLIAMLIATASLPALSRARR
jgi:hypothetical protein